ncbi:MAG: alpha/beta fold hydrolase [Cyanobacteria bacterium SZAS LIN-3]|nr:alpha/beta fold hydrolase [Cyanobacteria bacterium SZAS LIN-3]
MFKSKYKYGIRAALSISLLMSFVCASSAQSLTLVSTPYQHQDSYVRPLKYPTAQPKPAPCLVWTDPQVKPRVALLCVHGLGLHKGTYSEFGKEMCKAGITTYALDMRGFGEYIEQKKRPQMDFDGCLVDIKAALEQIHKDNPGLPVVLLGESMGGAIALRATALYPELVSGLISSVPAGDRFSLGETETKIGMRAFFGDEDEPIENVGAAVIEHATAKSDLRRHWMSDPLARMTFTAHELMQFNSFMKKNFEAARSIKTTPVLFVQGANDRLIRPAGTWKLYDRLGTSSRQLVLSKTNEHLIFEEGQFSPEDLNFVRTWIDRNVTHLDPAVLASASKLSAVASSPATATATQPPTPATTHSIAMTASARINFWIELFREGKLYRCNNKMQFKSGDVIRFHLIPENDGYAYLVMTAGTSGKSQVLFPPNESASDNFLHKGHDYAVPIDNWLQFDKTPGIEHLSLIFSKDRITPTPETLEQRYVTCYVSHDTSGAKDLVPTRMKLSWDDPKPVLIPDDFSGISQIKRNGADGSSLVRLMTGESSTPGGVLSADIALKHE